MFVVDAAADTVDGDTVSENVTAVITSTVDDGPVSASSDANAVSVSSSLVYTAAIVSTSLPVSTDVTDQSTAVTDTLLTVSSTGGMGDSSATAPLATAAISVVAASSATVSPQSAAASSISSPEQSTADVLDEHAVDAAMTIPLVREPGSSGTALHIKPSIPVVQSSSDTSMTADTGSVAADSVGEVSLVVAERGRGDRLAGTEAATVPATTSANVTASTPAVSATSGNMSAGQTASNDTEPLSDEVRVLSCLITA